MSSEKYKNNIFRKGEEGWSTAAWQMRQRVKEMREAASARVKPLRALVAILMGSDFLLCVKGSLLTLTEPPGHGLQLVGGIKIKESNAEKWKAFICCGYLLF